MLRLFYAPGACSLASHIALEELGEPFETIRLDLAAGDQRTADYLALNPNGRVPVLLTEAGPLTESPAILAYLADLKPALALLPADPLARARALARMNWFSAHLHVAFAHVWRPRRFTDDPSADEAMKTKALETVAAAFRELDAALAGRVWLFEHYTLADPYLLVMRRWGARVEMDMRPYPALLAHAERVAARPAAARAIAREGIRIDG